MLVHDRPHLPTKETSLDGEEKGIFLCLVRNATMGAGKVKLCYGTRTG